jgi:hypothetical protein
MFGMTRGVLPSGPDGTERLPGPAGAVVPRCRPPQRAAEGQGTRWGSPDRVVDQGGRIVLTSVLPTAPGTPDRSTVQRAGWVGGAAENSGGPSCRFHGTRLEVGHGFAAGSCGPACRSNRESGRKAIGVRSHPSPPGSRLLMRRRAIRRGGRMRGRVVRFTPIDVTARRLKGPRWEGSMGKLHGTPGRRPTDNGVSTQE